MTLFARILAAQLPGALPVTFQSSMDPKTPCRHPKKTHAKQKVVVLTGRCLYRKKKKQTLAKFLYPWPEIKRLPADIKIKNE